MDGLIFNIQHFSVHDGPGLRTTVFLKGCNLRCAWCHNPESISAKPELQYSAERCIGCGRCVDACDNNAISVVDSVAALDRGKCNSCLKCTETCYAKALSRVGITISAEALAEEIVEHMPYYNNCKSGGGVTFSGGECMLQPEFLKQVLEICKQHDIHTAIDTAGNVSYSHFAAINPLVDVYLYDIKAIDRELHRELTGAANDRILENLEHLKQDGKDVIVRVPVIPDVNTAELAKISSLLRGLGIDSWELLPYHSMGRAKENVIGAAKLKSFTEPDEAQMIAYNKTMIGDFYETI